VSQSQSLVVLVLQVDSAAEAAVRAAEAAKRAKMLADLDAQVRPAVAGLVHTVAELIDEPWRAANCCGGAVQVAANATQHTIQPMTTIERQINARLLRQIAQQAR